MKRIDGDRVLDLALRMGIAATFALMAAVTVLTVLDWWTVVGHAQFGVLGRGIPGGAQPSQTNIVASNISLVGYYRVPLTDDNGRSVAYAFPGLGRQGFAVHKVSGTNHFFISTSQNSTGVGAPVEFTEPGTYNSSGTCTSGTCPGTTYSTAPRISTANVVANWGVNSDGTAHDIYGGNINNLWDLSAGTLTQTCTGVGGACQPGLGTITPNGDWLVTYNASYGGSGGAGITANEATGSTASSGAATGAFLVHFIAPNTGGGARSTSVTGPYIFKDVAVPPATDYPTKGWAGTGFASRYIGNSSAGYWVAMPDGSIGWGASDSAFTQQGGAPNGVSLQVASAASWPTPSTTASASSRIVATQNWLHTWNLNGYYSTSGGALTTANWSFIPPEAYPYVYEGSGSACHNGACLEIDPLANGGQGSWTEDSAGGGGICINTATKYGCIFIMTTGTNHLKGNVTDCGHAHNWYNNGFPNCPLHSCSGPVGTTGPVATFVEDRWEFYSWTDMQSVKNGTKTDYTVSPVDTLFPAVTFSLPLTSATAAGISLLTQGQIVMTTAGGYDTNSNNFYVLFQQMDSANNAPIIGVFHVAQ